MRSLVGVLVALLLMPAAAWAACNPSNAPAGSPGCQPVVTSAAPTDTVMMWQPSSFPASVNQIAPGNFPIIGNGVTNPLATWAGYLAGVSNPNVMNFGAAPNFAVGLTVAGAAQSFPASGLLVGTTDTQTLTNKTLTGGSLTAANATGNSITNTLGTWASYLAGVPIPNPMTVGDPSTFGHLTITPINPAVIPSTPQVVNFIQATSSGGSGVKNAMENQVVITGAPTAFWWVNLNQLTYNGTGGGSAQHVAGYDQTLRNIFSSGGAANNANLWAHVSEMDDFTGQPSSATNNTLAEELDIRGNNVDNANNRQGISMVAVPATTGFYEVGRIIGLTVNPGAYVKTIIGGAGSYTDAILDLRNFVPYAKGQTSVSGQTYATVTAPVSSSTTVPVSNVIPFTSTVFGADLNLNPGNQNTIQFSDGQIAAVTSYAITGSGASPAGTLTLLSPITVASAVQVYNNSNAIWLATGQTIAFDSVGFTSISSDATTITSNANFAVTGTLKLKTYTVSLLPTCNSGANGSMAAVSDAASPTYNATLTGAGAIHVPVFCNGSAWTSH